MVFTLRGVKAKLKTQNMKQVLADAQIEANRKGSSLLLAFLLNGKSCNACDTCDFKERLLSQNVYENKQCRYAVYKCLALNPFSLLGISFLFALNLPSSPRLLSPFVCPPLTQNCFRDFHCHFDMARFALQFAAVH